jgi:hypothetical protein
MMMRISVPMPMYMADTYRAERFSKPPIER